MSWRRQVAAAMVLAAGACSGDAVGREAGESPVPGPVPVASVSPAASVRPVAPAAVQRPVHEMALRDQRILDGLLDSSPFRRVAEPVASPPAGSEATAAALADAEDVVRGLSAEAGGLTSSPGTHMRLDRLLDPWSSRIARARAALVEGDAAPAERVVADATQRREELVEQVRLLVAADRTARAGFLAVGPLLAVSDELAASEDWTRAAQRAHRRAAADTAAATSTALRVLAGEAGAAELEAALRRAAGSADGLADALAAPAE